MRKPFEPFSGEELIFQHEANAAIAVAKDLFDLMQSERDFCANERDQLRAENEKLRASLQKMVDRYKPGIDGLEYAVMCNELANEALKK